MTDFSEKARAKVNLHLKIIGKRTDGYHNLLSLMAPTEYHDLLKLENIEISSRFRVNNVIITSAGGRYPETINSIPAEDNLICRAITQYFNNKNEYVNAVISVEKNIPAGAGLAGGSSDAAAVLRLLNRIYASYSGKELYKIAARLGSDVPFCLFSDIAVCSGKGEIIETLQEKPFFSGYKVLLINNGIHIDTASAYRDLKLSVMKDNDMQIITETCRLELLEEIIQRKSFNCLKNDFEQLIFSRLPVLAQIKNIILAFSPDYVTMSGSGSAFAALFKDKNRASNALTELEPRVQFAVVTDFYKPGQ